MPRISVLLPVRNAAGTISAAIESALRQTERDVEVLVVDDGSTDGSGALADRAAARDARVRVLSHAAEGLVPALLAGIEAATGEWIARMDADDLMRRDRLARQREACDANAWVACGAHVRLFPRRGLKDGAREYERWIGSIDSAEAIARAAFVECPIVHPTLFARADVLRRFRYRDRGWPEDYDLILRLLEERVRIGVVPRRLLAWREAAGRLSRVDPRYAADAFARAKAHFLARGFLAREERYVLVGYGPTGKLLRAALAAEGKHPSHILDLHPGRIGQTIDGVRVEGGDALDRVPRGPMLVCVAHAGPREAARVALAAGGREELRDFVCCA